MKTSPPRSTIDPVAAPRRGDCPACGHSADTTDSAPDLIRWVMKLIGRPRAAQCGRVDEYDASGWGDAACACTHPFHGS